MCLSRPLALAHVTKESNLACFNNSFEGGNRNKTLFQILIMSFLGKRPLLQVLQKEERRLWYKVYSPHMLPFANT
jgi:hypothetical protein